jgi:uncharacterized membrane protein
MMEEKTYKKALFLRRRRCARPRYAGEMSDHQPPTEPRARTEPRAPTEPRVHEFVARVVVARPRHELYTFWRNFTNAPKFMANVAGVTEVDSLSSMWTVTDAEGKTEQWEMLVTDDEVDRLIAWSTSGNTPVNYSGRIDFQDAPRPDAAGPDAAGNSGTEVIATLRHEQHSGLVETLIEAVAGSHEAKEPPVQSQGDLARFKEFMEGHPAEPESRRDAEAG